MLSTSDSSSNQQFTAILTELAQTAGAINSALLTEKVVIPGVSSPPPEDDITICKNEINKGRYTNMFDGIEPSDKILSYIIHSGVSTGVRKVSVSINLYLDIPPVTTGERARIGKDGHNGLVAFYPVPATVTVNCVVGKNSTIPLMPPTVVNLYIDSHFVDPQRDFLTNPQNTYTFCSGFICGHKYTDQSPAKTIVDTGTAPVRALMPSVQVTTNTAWQTGGGKPDQITTTTNTQTSPSKGP